MGSFHSVKALNQHKLQRSHYATAYDRPSSGGERRVQSFQSTFCHVLHTEKSWKRHEESQHLPQREWTCMPHALPIKGPMAGNVECVFCGIPNLGTYRGHDCSRIQECLARSYEDRTFSRKDKLVQHLRQYHGVEMNSSVVDAWATEEPVNQIWRCGFGGEMLSSWEIRAKHIAKHFRQGYDTSLWSDVDDRHRF